MWEKERGGVEAIVKWINHLADLTLEIEILINLWAEALYFAVRGEGPKSEGDVVFHVTFFRAYSYARLGLGTLVPWDFVSTRPRDEGVGRRDRFFIGMSVGSSVGTKEGLCFRSEGEDVVADNMGIWHWKSRYWLIYEPKLSTLPCAERRKKMVFDVERVDLSKSHSSVRTRMHGY